MIQSQQALGSGHQLKLGPHPCKTKVERGTAGYHYGTQPEEAMQRTFSTHAFALHKATGEFISGVGVKLA